jgi:transposase
MKPRIYPKEIGGKTYYYYQYTKRVKINSEDTGKGPGSGKSKVATFSEYLGTATGIREKIKSSKRSCTSLRQKSFGFSSAIYQTCKKIGLDEILRKYITGERYRIPRYVFFLMAIINRLDHASSKEKIGLWAKKTVFPELLGFNPSKLNSKTFWYVTDDVISERELRKFRKENDCFDDIFAGIDDEIFVQIEREIFERTRELLCLEPSTIAYDTTNFFTYIQPGTPSELAKTGKNKENRNHLKQIGLTTAVDMDSGIPLFHKIYKGNTHDTNCFSGIIDDLILRMKYYNTTNEKPVIVLDKGNNREDNFSHLKGKAFWVGSLVPSHFNNLLKTALSSYRGKYRELEYITFKQQVMGEDCFLVLTFNKSLYKKQKLSLRTGIEKCKQQLKKKLDSYKRKPINKLPAGIHTLKKEHRYGKYINVDIENSELIFTPDISEIKNTLKRCGKNLLFTNKLTAAPEWVIEHYKDKNILEQDYHILKSPDIIRNRPIRHWTDTKIRAFCFSCVCALLIARIMELTVEKNYRSMSIGLIKEELQDLKLITMIYEKNDFEIKVTDSSTVQQKLFDIFNLQEIEKKLTIHL